MCPNRANIAYDATPVRWDLARVVRDGDGFTLAPDGIFALAQGPADLPRRRLLQRLRQLRDLLPDRRARRSGTSRASRSTAATYAAGRRHPPADPRPRRLDHPAPPGGSREVSLARRGETLIYTTPEARLELDARTLAVRAVTWLDPTAAEVRLQPAAALAVLLAHLADTPLAIDEEA